MVKLPRGPITFAEYMELCLYDAALGYYTSGRQVFGPSGDFYTSAHTHPLFAEILADSFTDLLRSFPQGQLLQMVELGPGDRSLGKAILTHLDDQIITYIPVDVNAVLPERIRGIVFSNEFFDALPVHRVRVVNGELRELYVEADEKGGIAETEAPVSDERIRTYAKTAFGRLREGWEYEVNLRMVECLQELDRRIEQAFVFTIDYGFLREEYHRAERAGGTLLSYSRHRVVEDPYLNPGEQDLTAHVNFSVMIEKGRAMGWVDDRVKSQRQFMEERGLSDRLMRLEQSFGDLNADRVQELLNLKRLIEPGGISDTMRVLVQRVRV